MKIAFRIIRCALSVILLAAFILALASDSLVMRLTPPTDEMPVGPGVNVPDSPDDTPSRPSEPILPDDTVPAWSIDPIVVKNTLTDQSGKVLCEMRYSYPTVTSSDGSDVSEFARELEVIASRVRLFVDTKSALYKSGSGDDFSVPPQITGYYKVNRFSSEIFSITFVFAEIAPDATISETYINYNLDLLLSSRKISVDSVMNDAVGSVKSKLQALRESGKISLLANYENMLVGLIDESWSVETEGISFKFAKGSLAPASYGDIEIFIENAELISLLSDYGRILLNLSDKAGDI